MKDAVTQFRVEREYAVRTALRSVVNLVSCGEKVNENTSQ